MEDAFLQNMSTQSQSSDAYSMYKQNVQKYFENITKQTPQYFQSVTHLQDECMKTCEKTISATVSMQQEFAKKSGIKTDIPDFVKTAIVDGNKQLFKQVQQTIKWLKLSLMQLYKTSKHSTTT